MQLIFELFPLIAFFAAYQWGGIQAATLAALVASALQIGWLKLRHLPVTGMQWFSLIILVVFGGATLLHHDPRFIQFKPTALYSVLALSLVVAPRLTGRNPLQTLLGAQITLPATAWPTLSRAWFWFFVLMAVLNLYVVHRFTLSTWVQFKLFGTLGLTLLFIVGQALWMSRLTRQGDASNSH